MGDGGAQFLGFMIAGLVLADQSNSIGEVMENTARLRLRCNLLPFALVMSSIPILDTFAAIWRRKREGRSFYTADTFHLHHKLLRLGFTNKSILCLILTIQIILGGISLFALICLSPNPGFIVLCFAFVLAVIFFSIIHYLHKPLAHNPLP
jgi:UDP-GlcNAc:undecaprenyl-phosphate GlcNAc-1-phosphate transferase